ncbi:hypothetical protein J2X58_002426 [Luteibacter sp. 3190]|nr:hypothetical protein [Luteibacter sp. 3190]
MTLNRWGLFFAMCFVCMCTPLSASVASASENIADAAALTICSNQGLPAGYVVTASDVNSACPGIATYRWTISPASNGIQACFGSGYPAPYVITGINTVSSVCAGFQGGMTLRLPTNNIAICSPSVIWDPWVITGNGITTSQCGGYGISTIAQASEGLAVCSNTPIPSGWTVTGGSSSVQCQPWAIQTLHRVALMTSGNGGAAIQYRRVGDMAVRTTTPDT